MLLPSGLIRVYTHTGPALHLSKALVPVIRNGRYAPDSQMAGYGELYAVASLTAPHAFAGNGSCQRSCPTGGCANGIPRNRAPPPSRAPKTYHISRFSVSASA